jgi:6-phosphogluconolactonase (cycloisomerase 2 family)
VALNVIAGALVLAFAGRAHSQFVYVNNNITTTNTISALAADAGGALTPVPGSPFDTGGGGSFSANLGSVNVLVTASRLYATNALSNTIAAFDINLDGSLSTIPGSPFPTLGTRPNGIAINAAGTRLFVAHFNTGNVAVFNIASNGALTHVSGSPFALGTGSPLDLAIDSVNSILFASHQVAGVGVYTIGVGGSLTPIVGSPFAAGGFDERGLATNAASTRLYIADRDVNSVSAYTIGGGGTLTAVGGSPFAAGTAPVEALVHPSLSVLYVSNESSNDISTYDIGGGGGLTPKGGSPFASGGTGTAGMAIDDISDRLFAVNHTSLDVSVFDIDGSGNLTAVAGSPFTTGAGTGTPVSIALAVFDTDGDGVANSDDNCPFDVNPLQTDTDGDGIGDDCDAECTAAAPGECIPGRGKPQTECFAEWQVLTDPPPSINPITNLPDFRIECQNGNAGCDADNTATDDHCTFEVRVCLNNSDPRLAACSALDVAKFDLKKPRPGAGANTAFDNANIVEFQKAMSGGTCDNDSTRSCLVNGDCQMGGVCTGPPVIGVPFVKGKTTLIAGATSGVPDNCSNVIPVQVPLRLTPTGYKKRTRVVRYQVRTSPPPGNGQVDTDFIKLTCIPAP